MGRKSKSKKRSFEWKQVALLSLFGLIAIGGLSLLIIGLLGKESFTLPQREIAGTVNGETISTKELDTSYNSAVPLEYQQFVTKWQFLNESVIPQKLLLQEARKAGFLVTQKQVDSAIAEFLSQNQMTIKELERELSDQGLSRKDIEATLSARLAIAAYVNSSIIPGIEVTQEEIAQSYEENNFAFHNVSLEEATPFLSSQILIEKQGDAVLLEIARLRENATIVIFLEQAKQLISSFTESEEEICATDGRLIVRMFTSSTCSACEGASERLQKILNSADLNGSIQGHVWEIDTGDDLLTKEKEKGVPKFEIALFRTLSQNLEVPAYSFGCKYTRVGHLLEAEGNLNAEEKEFNDVITTLLVEHG